ncbi:hypothetical protein [Streptomyces nigrescens]|uniref:hypothetical protein n=1 Tax=Streptomyces nigrescens TaxID=1920 RepID=UPI0036F9DD22
MRQSKKYAIEQAANSIRNANNAASSHGKNSHAHNLAKQQADQDVTYAKRAGATDADIQAARGRKH